MTGLVMITKGGGCGGGEESGSARKGSSSEDQNSLSVVAVLVAALRKSMVTCRVADRGDEVMSAVQQMEIGWPTNVRHVTHVTFDRFNGFLGLPVEFEVEIPCRVPSASASVFGVSAESMQCSYDSKGNSVPTILLLMQERLYSQEGLKAEGIFRINPENSQEEHVRDQLNRGIVPDDIDVHCLAGLIKAWFRELPSGVLDGLSPEQVLECNTEEQFVKLIKQLKPMDSALLNWAVDLMADVVEEEEFNKMNSRNIAMVFAPNMTQMSDPLTALMHAVQVMNLLKTLITKVLREREENATEGYSPLSSHSYSQHSDEGFDSQQEMDTSCESRGHASDDDDHENLSHSSEDENEVESLNEIEECFLRQLGDANENVIGSLSGKSVGGDTQRSHSSLTNCAGFRRESAVSFTDSKKDSSASSLSDAENSSTSPSNHEQKADERNSPSECKSTSDVIKGDRLAKVTFFHAFAGV